MSRLPACLALLLAAPLVLGACTERYSPDTYATRAVQQANKVEQGVVVGVRKVQISAEGTVGAATGAAAGGVIGAQTPGGGLAAALGGVGGALVGGLVGKAAESTAVDQPAYEYVVRTEKEDLISVTQTDAVPLALNQKVLVITGTQARVVPDYTVAAAPPAAPKQEAKAPEAGGRDKPDHPAAGTGDPAAAAAAGVIQQMMPASPAPPVLVPAPPSPGASLPSVAAPVAAAVLGGQAEKN